MGFGAPSEGGAQSAGAGLTQHLQALPAAELSGARHHCPRDGELPATSGAPAAVGALRVRASRKASSWLPHSHRLLTSGGPPPGPAWGGSISFCL